MPLEVKIVKRNKIIAVAAIFTTIIMPIIGYFGIPMPVFQSQYETDIKRIEIDSTYNKIDILKNSIEDLKREHSDYVIQKLHTAATIEEIKRESGKGPTPELITLQGNIDSKLAEIESDILEKKRVLSLLEEANKIQQTK